MSSPTTVRSIRFPNDLLSELEAKLDKGTLNAYVIDAVRTHLQGRESAGVVQPVTQPPPVSHTQAATPQPKAGYSTGHKPGCRCLLCNPPSNKD